MTNKKRYAKFCPKCKGLNIAINQRGGLVAFGVPAFYVCRECGFRSYVFPEIEIKKKNITKRYLKRKID
jgi:predicted RNA-binding Zn-ribbon protein involved in translation (DUF1610 family)